MKFRVRFKPNESQGIAFDDDLTKFLHFSAGFGSGKTFWLCMKLLKLSRLNQHIPGGLIAPSYADFKKDVHPVMEEILDDNKISFLYNKNDHFFKFPWTDGKLYVATAEKKLRGPNWGFAGINELTLIPLVRYKEVIGRVRIRKSKFPQVVSNGTPEGIASDYYTIFVEKPWTNARVVYGDTRQNAHNLQPDYIQSLEDSYDSVMLDAYLKGLWVNMNGHRFYYAYDPTKNDDTTIKEYPDQTVHVSMDFNVDPMTAACWHQTTKGLIGFDEIILGQGKGSDTKEMARALKARGYIPERTIIYPDPAGLSRTTKGRPDVTILKDEGFENIRVKNAAPRMRQRQLNTNNLLEKHMIMINPDKMPKTKKDFLAVELNPITLDKDKKNPQLTHLSDGVDYMCDILYPLSGVKPNTRVEKFR